MSAFPLTGKGRLEDGPSTSLATVRANGLGAALSSIFKTALVACYDFRYDISEPRELEDDWDDVILVLKKR